jgi:hypothetical protein
VLISGSKELSYHALHHELVHVVHLDLGLVVELVSLALNSLELKQTAFLNKSNYEQVE